MKKSLPAFSHPLDGPTQDFSQVVVAPGTSYHVLLADPGGNRFDTQWIWRCAGPLVDLHSRMVSGSAVGVTI